jgi:hypothetical protein
MNSHDSRGPYFRWGTGPHTKKYYYTAGDKGSRDLARSQAQRQGRAVEASKHRAAKLGGSTPAVENIFAEPYVKSKSKAKAATKEKH